MFDKKKAGACFFCCASAIFLGVRTEDDEAAAIAGARARPLRTVTLLCTLFPRMYE
jgi:hypothetical protein